MTYESGTLAPESVRGMFDRIAPVYDVMNRVMTVGLDRRWRKLAVAEVVWPGDRVLDACCGTGDLAVEAERRGGRVVGLDFSPRDARARAAEVRARSSGCRATRSRCRSATASSTRPPSASACATSPTSRAGFAQLARVLRPGGKLAVLEITRPTRRPAARSSGSGSTSSCPFAGRVLPGGQAYTYLPASVRRFPGADDLSALFEAAGFEDVRYRLLGGGIVALHVGTRP